MDQPGAIEDIETEFLPIVTRIGHRLLKQEIYMTTRFLYVSRPFNLGTYYLLMQNSRQRQTAMPFFRVLRLGSSPENRFRF